RGKPRLVHTDRGCLSPARPGRNRFIICLLLRSSLLLVLSTLAVCLAVWVVPLSGAAAPPKPSLANWTKAKHAKVLEPSKAPAPSPAPPPAAASGGSGAGTK